MTQKERPQQITGDLRIRYRWRRADGKKIPKAHTTQLFAEADRRITDMLSIGAVTGDLRLDITPAHRTKAIEYRGSWELVRSEHINEEQATHA